MLTSMTLNFILDIYTIQNLQGNASGPKNSPFWWTCLIHFDIFSDYLRVWSPKKVPPFFAYDQLSPAWGHYYYPIHPSETFAFAPTQAANLYLLLPDCSWLVLIGYESWYCWKQRQTDQPYWVGSPKGNPRPWCKYGWLKMIFSLRVKLVTQPFTSRKWCRTYMINQWLPLRP